MFNYLKIYIVYFVIFICLGNVFASVEINKVKYSNCGRYKLCQSDSDADNQSDIYQEPSQEGDENVPAEIIKQPDENQNSSEAN